MRTAGTGAVAVVLLATLAAAQQGPGPDDIIAAERERATREVTFYGHVFGAGIGAPMPANTIFPKGDANLGLGSNQQCGGPYTASGQSPPCDRDPGNGLALFLTAGPVQVHSIEEFAYEKLHNERGRTKDVVLDKSGKVTASLWMTLDFFGWAVGNGGDNTFCLVHLPADVGCPYPYWGWDPAYWPQWVVEAWLYATELGEYGQGASDPPPFLEKWQSNDLTLVAHGATAPQDVQNGLPGQPNVHEFVIDLGNPQVDLVPKTHDIVLVYTWYSLINGEKVGGYWRLWAGEQFPTRFTLPVKNPLDVELVIPQFIHDKLLIHGVLASAWGSYDVDVAGAKLTVTDAGNRPVEVKSVDRVGDYQVAHGAHFKPVNVTWIWDYKADRLAPGAYKVAVEACNVQHSACETTEGAFSIDRALRPVQLVVGRQGQATISEGQLRALTGAAETGEPVSPTTTEPGSQAGPTPAKTPGFGAALAALGFAGALALRRRR